MLHQTKNGETQVAAASALPPPLPEPGELASPLATTNSRKLLTSRSTPAFLISLIAHTVALILLAIWVLQVKTSGPASQGLLIEASYSSREPAEQLLITDGQADSAMSVAAENDPIASPTSGPQDPARTLAVIAQSGDATAESAQAAMQSTALTNLLEGSSSTARSAFTATGVDGRSSEQRPQLARQLGGNRESEQAVENALRWLAEHQLPNGGWSLVHDGGKCNGRCRHPGSKERFAPAATGLALLAFLGAGYTHVDGEYKDNVQRGLYFLFQVLEDTPQGGSFLYTSDRGMYNHGIAAFALCEAYQMTLDPDLKKAAQQAINFIVNAQSYSGGWGYLPGTPGDLTISGWQVMALKSAHAAGLEIASPVTFGIDRFLVSQGVTDSHQFTYRRRPDEAPTCTAIGNLIRMFRGTSTTDPVIIDAAQYFLNRGLSRNDVYYNYYGSLYLFHIGGPLWDRWNAPLRDHLIQTQATGGHEAGSWYFDNPYGKEGGRLYTTAMAAMTLEVYYRYSPLYQQTHKPFEL